MGGDLTCAFKFAVPGLCDAPFRIDEDYDSRGKRKFLDTHETPFDQTLKIDTEYTLGGIESHTETEEFLDSEKLVVNESTDVSCHCESGRNRPDTP